MIYENLLLKNDLNIYSVFFKKCILFPCHVFQIVTTIIGK